MARPVLVLDQAGLAAAAICTANLLGLEHLGKVLMAATGMAVLLAVAVAQEQSVQLQAVSAFKIQ
jgi:hypothetical protein